MTVMEKIGTYPFVTESYLLDFKGRITLPMLGNYLLHAASCHADTNGFGFSDMTHNRTAWVLSRLSIEMNSYPTVNRNITVSTWVEDVMKYFTVRCFDIRNEAGQAIGYARSIWAAIDMTTRRPTLLDEERLRPFITDRPCPIEKMGKIEPVEHDSEGETIQVHYSDLDINGHFNSIKYIEHLLDLFDLEMFNAKNIRRFDISYIAEGKYGMNLALHKKEIKPEVYHAAICNEEKAIARSSIIWE